MAQKWTEIDVWKRTEKFTPEYLAALRERETQSSIRSGEGYGPGMQDRPFVKRANAFRDNDINAILEH